MRYVITLAIILFCSPIYAAPSITSVSGTFEDGETITINGTFTNDGSDTPIRWKTFDDNVLTGSGWTVNQAGLTEWSLTTTGAHSGYSARRFYVSQNQSYLYFNGDAALSASGVLYASFWCQLDSVNDKGGKIFRWYFGPDSSNDNMYLSSGNTNSNLRGASEVPGTPTEFGQDTMSYDNWHLIEFIGDKVNNHVTVYLDGSITWEHDDWFTGATWNPTEQFNAIQWASLVDTPNCEILYDDIYVNYTKERCFVAENADGSGHREMLIPSARSTSQITAIFNKRTFADSIAYLVVVDSNGSQDIEQITIGNVQPTSITTINHAQLHNVSFS